MIKHHIHREAPNTSDRPTSAAIGDAGSAAKPNSVSISNQTETSLGRKKISSGPKTFLPLQGIKSTSNKTKSGPQKLI